MGVSTDAILFWGYCWTDETSKPWTIGKDDEDEGEDDEDEGEDDDWEKRLAAASGLTEPTEVFPDLRDPKTFRDREPTTAEAAIIEKYRRYWDAQRKLVKASGCEVGRHCSDECTMPYVAISASEVRACRGGPVEIETVKLAIDPSWPAQINEFCAKLGIKTDGLRLGWWLVSWWS